MLRQFEGFSQTSLRIVGVFFFCVLFLPRAKGSSSVFLLREHYLNNAAVWVLPCKWRSKLGQSEPVLLKVKEKLLLNILGVKSLAALDVAPVARSRELREAFDGWKWMQTFIVDSSLFMHCTALHRWFAPSIVMCLASAETFSPCAACALHYGCAFVCLRYWSPGPALLCNAKLIWPVVFLAGKVITFFMQSISMKVILGV